MGWFLLLPCVTGDPLNGHGRFGWRVPAVGSRWQSELRLVSCEARRTAGSTGLPGRGVWVRVIVKGRALGRGWPGQCAWVLGL